MEPGLQHARWMTSAAGKFLEIAATNTAAFQFVAVWSGPVGFKIDVALVTICLERIDLACPVDFAFAERPPHRLVTVEPAVFRVNVSDAADIQKTIATGIRNFT